MHHSVAATSTATDPVCLMIIDIADAAGSSTYNGQTYYFCARSCEAKFVAAPASYIEPLDTSKDASCCSTGHSCC